MCTHITLNADNCLVGVCDRLSFCDLTDHSFAGLRKRNDGRCGSGTFGVRDNGGFAAFVGILLALGASLVAQRLKRLPGIQETRVRSLGREDTLEKEMATHSSILGMENPMEGGAW